MRDSLTARARDWSPSDHQVQHVGLAYDKLAPHASAGNRDAQSRFIRNLVANNGAPEGYGLWFQRHVRRTPPIDAPIDGKRVAMTRHVRLVASQGRVLCGLGELTPTENGLAVHHTYGVPYLPGSSLKGIVKAWCRETCRTGEWREGGKAFRDAFGDPASSDDEGGYAGAVCFLDALWVPGEPDLPDSPWAAEIATPHFGQYYCNDPKHPEPDGTESPRPVVFLAAQGGFRVVVEGPAFLAEPATELLCEALERRGIGAKSRAGYGRFRVLDHLSRADEAERQAREERDAARARAQAFAGASTVGDVLTLLNRHEPDRDLRGEVIAWLTGGERAHPRLRAFPVQPESARAAYAWLHEHKLAKGLLRAVRDRVPPDIAAALGGKAPTGTGATGPGRVRAEPPVRRPVRRTPQGQEGQAVAQRLRPAHRARIVRRGHRAPGHRAPEAPRRQARPRQDHLPGLRDRPVTRRVFLSFVGLGNTKRDPGYDALDHHLPDGSIRRTRFSQVATAGLHGPATFDRFALLATPESERKHRALLDDELRAAGASEAALRWLPTLDATSQATEDHWRWFGTVMRQVRAGDEVVFDFTHGFRSVPIVLATALSFVQRTTPFTLLGAYYTFVDVRGAARVVDMGPFFQVERWADAVSALTRNADAEPLAELAQNPDVSGFPALEDPELADAFRDLTRAIKDVDMNGVAGRAHAALAVARRHLDRDLSDPERTLLNLVVERFGALGEHVGSGRYDRDYFQVQVLLVRTLVEHGMHMQAYTVMREVIASLGMLWASPKYRHRRRTSADGRKGRGRFGELFVRMCQFDRDRWSFSGQEAVDVEHLLRGWEALDAHGLLDDLVALTRAVVGVRNALDHGWTSKATAVDIRHDARQHVRTLSALVDRIAEQGWMVTAEEAP